MQVKRRVDEWSLLCFHMQMSGWLFFHSNFETVINFDDVFRCRPCAKRSVETPHQKLHSSLCILCWSAESNKSSRLFFWFFLRPLLLLLLLLLPNLKSFILRTNDKNECKIAVECWHCYFVMALRATGFIYYSWRAHNFCVKSYTHVRETKVFMQTKCCRFDIMSLIPNRFAMKVFLLTLINEPFFFSLILKSPTSSNMHLNLNYIGMKLITNASIIIHN